VEQPSQGWPFPAYRESGKLIFTRRPGAEQKLFGVVVIDSRVNALYEKKTSQVRTHVYSGVAAPRLPVNKHQLSQTDPRDGIVQ